MSAQRFYALLKIGGVCGVHNALLRFFTLMRLDDAMENEGEWGIGEL